MCPVLNTCYGNMKRQHVYAIILSLFAIVTLIILTCKHKEKYTVPGLKAGLKAGGDLADVAGQAVTVADLGYEIAMDIMNSDTSDKTKVTDVVTNVSSVGASTLVGGYVGSGFSSLL